MTRRLRRVLPSSSASTNPDGTTVGIVVSSPFVHVLLCEATNALGLKPVVVKTAAEVPAGWPAVVADLSALGPQAPTLVQQWSQAGTSVFVLGRKHDMQALRALAALGAHTGERGELLAKLPDLLAALFRTSHRER